MKNTLNKIKNIIEDYLVLNIDNIYFDLIENPSERLIDAIIDNGHDFYLLENPTEKQCIKAVSKEPYNISYIKDPSIEVQKTAIKILPSCIQYIKNPSQEIQMLAVKDDPSSIRYIKKPCAEAVKYAILNGNMALDYLGITLNTKELQLLAINRNIQFIYYIKKPCQEVKDIIIKSNDKDYLHHIFCSLSEKEQRSLLEKDGSLIFTLSDNGKKIPRGFVKIAVETCPLAIKLVKKPSEKLKRLVLSKDGSIISLIKNPSEELQLIAVNQDPYSVSDIKNPSVKIKEIAIKNSGFDPAVIYRLNIDDLSEPFLEEMYNSLVVQNIIK